MVIKNNVNAMNANRANDANQIAKAKTKEKLSSGFKINRAADDASGLAISEKMRRQIFALSEATANAQSGISSIQTAEGAMGQVSDMLGRMNELAVKAGNETLSAEDKYSIKSEMNALRSEIDRVAETTTFNGQKLLDGSFADGKRIQVGAEVTDGNQISINIGKMDWASLSGNGTFDIGNKSQIAETLDFIKGAMKNVATMRSDMGATQNRLGNTISSLKNTTENTTAAESAVRDTDMAQEMVKFSLQNILAKTNEAMQAHAKQSGGLALRLLT
ncbi:MAG: flagellin [Lachnospiraceae bacterium]|nr:flagellin [Lachnospiraceae bacterium]